MIYFTSDYVAGAHPKVMRALCEDNLNTHIGYSEDECSRRAAGLVREWCAAPQAAVHFVPGGTQANLLVCAAAMRPHQSVLAPASGHINKHETGAIEATGHKVSALSAIEGKLDARQIKQFADEHRADASFEHIVQPKLVYLSQPTEYGTLYSRAQLQEISRVCRREGLLLYVDGARMGYGLCAPGNDIDLPFLAKCCDAFSIGGTKVGALFGEAIVLCNPALAEDFRYIIKQKGAMLAKGWLLGLQFEALLAGSEGCAYLEGSRHAIRLAVKLADAIAGLGIPLLMPPATNQIFPVLPNAGVAKLREGYLFEDWERVDEEHLAVRFCTAWSTREEDVDALIRDLGKL